MRSDLSSGRPIPAGPPAQMSEKPESDEIEDEELDEPVSDGGDVDLDQVIKDLDLAKRRAQKVGDPAWRRLERLLGKSTPPSSPWISRTTRSATPATRRAGPAASRATELACAGAAASVKVPRADR